MIYPTLLLAATVWFPARIDGWPQYNGAASDRTSTEAAVSHEWNEAGPPIVWRVEAKAGFSSFVIAGERAFTLVGEGGRETLVALGIEDGKSLWRAELCRTDYDGGGDAGASGNGGGDGPRSTPSVDGERVYVLDAQLVLHCADASTGRQVWRRDIRADYGGAKIKWQNAASPLVEGDHVLVAGGGPGKSLLAFHKLSGKLVWARGDERLTHATPIAATIHGRRQVVFYVESGLVACDPLDGAELWRTDYPHKVSSAASPVVSGDLVYVSAGYGVGAGVFRIESVAGQWSASLVWQQRNKLMNHWSTPVCHDGYLYGMFSFKKYGEGPLCCVELATGKVMWSEPGFGPGNSIAVGDTLIALSDAGDVVLAELTPRAYVERSRTHVLEGKCWSSPALAAGQLYVRSTEQAARLDLR